MAASEEVPIPVCADSFTCGNCSTTFRDLVAFLEHKRSTSCGLTLPYNNASLAPENVTVLAEASDVAEAPTVPEISPPTEGTELTVTVSKKRGRPRKIDKSLTAEVEPQKPANKTASIGEDGMFCCDVCKLKFKRERHFKSHKCKGGDDTYVKPEDFPELEDGFDSRTRFPVDGQPGASATATAGFDLLASDDDETEDYNPRIAAAQLAEDEGDDQDADDGDTSKGRRHFRRHNIVASDPKKKLEALSLKRQIATYPIPQTLDDIPDIPVFPDEESRQNFESKVILMVDLSQTHDMYKTHLIEQTLNSNAISGVNRVNSEISLHSCNTCEKVFKSLSHIRHHCLTHIDSKPFKCPECPFRANARGNIYSHMRKHTGQMYRCGTCEFKTVNKSHLLEHEATHSGTVHACALCQRHYSTAKSLINHIRIYHCKTEEGRTYYQKFVHLKEGPGSAMLFECHICDRKFKKESDRDRHLYVHNVRLERTLSMCKICNYETDKSQLLDSHYLKHRYIYACSMCDVMKASVKSLLVHLNAEHVVDAPYESLPDECIGKSLYLPDTRTSVIENPTTEGEADQGEMFVRLGYQPMTTEMFNSLREKYGQHECEECGLLFKTGQSCEEHLNHHKGEKPFSCDFCEYTAFSKNSLKLHINSHHEDKQFKCDLCDFISKSKLALIDHRNRHETFQCPICSQYLAGRRGLRNHLLSKHVEVDAEMAQKMSGYGRRTGAMRAGKAFKCPYCDKTFTNNNVELQKHIWAHEGIKPFKCDVCDYSCRTRSNLTSHMLKHTEQKPYPCSYCGKRYKSKTALRWHERSHASGRLFKCNKCSYEGVQKSHLVRHMETHNLVKRFSCNHCYYSANTIGYMRVHYTKAHPGVTYTQSSNTTNAGEVGIVGDNVPPNVYTCVSCDYLFGNLSDMKRHLRNKHRIHMTDINVVNGQEVVTQIVPLQNQDGITSDVQIIRIPLETGMETDGQYPSDMQTVDGQETYVDAGELGEPEMQLMKTMEVDTDDHGELQTVVMDYTHGEDANSVLTISAADNVSDPGSQLYVQTLPADQTQSQRVPGVSLLKSSQPPAAVIDTVVQSEESQLVGETVGTGG